MTTCDNVTVMADYQEEIEKLLQNEEEEEEDSEQFLEKETGNKGFCNKLVVLFYKLLYGIFPTLTCNSGEVKLTRKRSCLILLLLYSSHLFSAWVGLITYMYSSKESINAIRCFKLTHTL